MRKNNTKDLDKYFKKILEETSNIKKVLQQSNDIISNNIVNTLLEKYKELLYGDSKKNVKNLYMMNSVSLQIQNVTDNFPNKYTITDKADGERCGLFIYNNKIYMISTILDVKYSGIELSKNLSDYNNTIIVERYIFRKI